MGAAVAAGEIALKVLAWIWNHKLLALVIGLAAALLWSRHEVSSLTIERDGYHAKIEAAEHEEGIWRASYEGAAKALKARREQDDAEDARAKRQQEITDGELAKLTAQHEADQAELQSFRAQIERESHDPNATAASVARSVLERLQR